MIYTDKFGVEFIFNPKNIFMASFDKNNLSAKIIPAGSDASTIPTLFFETENDFLFFKQTLLNKMMEVY